MANKLKQLRAQRDLWHDRLIELEGFARRASAEEAAVDMFKIRYSDLDNIKQEFTHQHNLLLSTLAVTENPDFETEKAVVTSFDNSYYTIKSIYHSLLKNETQVSQTSARQPNVRLPKIDVPKFDGNFNDWPTFINLFRSLVHNNITLTNSEKFQFLLMSLSKNPLSIIKSIPLTDENYPVAYNALTARYQNTRILANSYWKQIIHAPKLKSKSSTDLRDLLDRFSENLEALKILKLPVEHWDFVMFNILVSKLDEATVTRFELECSSTNIPSYVDLVNFLQKQCTAYETVSLTLNGGIDKSKPANFNKTKPSVSHKPNSSCFVNAIQQPSTKCILCNSYHPLYKCSLFLEKVPFDRYNFAKQNNLCLNCLNSSHHSAACHSKFSCRTCQAKHHTLLHFVGNTPDAPSSSIAPPPIASSVTSPSTSTAITNSTPTSHVSSLTNILPQNSTVLLSTAVIEICDVYGHFHKVRALLDSASQASFITERCANRLGLPRSRSSLSIHGLGEMSSQALGYVTSTIRPVNKFSPQLPVDALILPKICGTMPPQCIPNRNFSKLSNIKLADPKFNVPCDVDLLLGADIFPLILTPGHLMGNESQPTAINTIFGWILMGKISCSSQNFLNSFHSALDYSLDQSIKKFWELEEVPDLKASSSDLLCEKSFVENHSRDQSGRYIVALPFKDTEPSFSDSRSIALRRFFALENRLLRDPSLHMFYSEFMKDYLDSGHMAEIPTSHLSSEPNYYIPHHSIFKPDSTTTKLRVVFDASCKSSDGISLNETLLVGPKLQKDITSILLNFRLHQFVFTADIKQMYRQILIHRRHWDYQRILWRFAPTDPIKDFWLKTVTYGITSAPFLALRTLIQLANDEAERFPHASKVLFSDIYVDDLVTGSDSLEAALHLQKELISLLANGGFLLRKWTSNNPLLVESIPLDCRYEQDISFDDSNSVGLKILGLKWIPLADQFSYSVEPLERSCTKRTILSELARIFDPIGFLAPVSFFAKYLIQHLWALGLQWDQSPPSDILKCWNQYKRELHHLSSLRIPRCIKPLQVKSCDLHGFCDSSEKGYAAVIYLRFTNGDDNITVSFVCAKSKVAPLKRISLPRLELCAAVLLSNLIEFLLKTYSGKLQFHNIFAWSDSSIVLSWVKSSPHRWKTFVSNRVSHIQERLAPTAWHHVRSLENPADCASRGLMPKELVDHPLWWAGPSWLKHSSDLWPVSEVDERTSLVLDEERKLTFATTIIDNETFFNLLEKYSSLSKIKRIIAYCLRFCHNLKNPNDKKSGIIDIFDLQQALVVLIKYSQYKTFQNDIDKLFKNKQTSKFLRKLNPFLDEGGILRVGGRLVNSTLSLDQKHPILLSRNCRLTTLIIEETHREHCHPGVQTLQYLLSQNYWILSPKRAIRSVVSNCYRCFRHNPKPLEPFMGNLPTSRVSQLKPFSCVGVDFGGPFTITLGKYRGAKTHKAYICLFVCFSTKALHLELVSDLSSDAFLAAFRRFIARRGRCSYIFSDCGTNFTAASKYIADLMKTAVETEKISWSFNPPSAPHFGGLWEAGIKSVKSHLFRTIGQQILTFEEFSTLLTQIEALLNSRPICSVSSDPNDLRALTPGHFLTLEPLTVLPDKDLTHLKLNTLSRWQLLQRLHQDFWNRWHQEYLHTLIQRNKWNKHNSLTVPGTLVLIKEDTVSPLNWRLGRIVKLHPGKDGIFRVATIRVGKGITQRPLVKLCPLPNQEQ